MAATVLVSAPLAWVQPAHAATASVSVWNITALIGHNPDASREDVTGLTAQVATPANPLSLAAAIDNSTNPEGPCGLIYWNPATGAFKDYGFTGGFADDVDINLTAPPLTGVAGTVFGTPTFQPGDTWVTVSFSSRPLNVNFKGTNNFRHYFVGSGGLRGVKVDQATGLIYFTDTSGGTINRLDPTTSAVTTWAVGGSPYYLTRDGLGNVFATVASFPFTTGAADAIVKLTPGSGGVTAWPIPGGGLVSGFIGLAANGIARDSAGNIWFDLSAGNKVGRLNPGNNEICEFTQAGPPPTASPQQIASSGSGSTLQGFYTEAGAGEAGTDLPGAVSVLTQASAPPITIPCPAPAPEASTVTPSTSTAPFTDIIHTPRLNTITPLVVSVTSTSSSGIDRFPMPFPTGGTPTAPNAPSGMTGVIAGGSAGNTIAGSYQDTSFTTNSAVFTVTSAAIIAPPPGAKNKCPLTQGFWKNHASAWPVASLMLGSQTYTQAELLTLLRTPPKGDASLILARQLIAAKLNIANGSDPAPISATIADADSLLAAQSGKLPYLIAPSSTTGQSMINDATKLEDYNGGGLTPNCTP